MTVLLARSIRMRRDILHLLAGGAPMSTPDLQVAMAHHAGCAAHAPCLRPGSCRAWCWYQRLYPQLRAMERAGLLECDRRRQIPTRCVWWRRIDDESDEAMNAALGES